MKISREDWYLIIGGAAIVSFIFAGIQEWLKLQLIYFVAILGAIAVVTGIAWKKEAKKTGMIEAVDIGKDILKALDAPMMTGTGGKLNWISKHSDNKRFSSRGKVFDMEFDGVPNKAVVQLDARTGEPVNVALDTQGRDPPFFAEYHDDLTEADPGTRKYRKRRKLE